MAQVYTVTASTSVVLVSTLGVPNTIVYLSSISYPGHLVGIVDTTGSPALSAQPIVVSTVNGIRFYDGSFSTLITTPLGSLTVASKTPTTWQVLNNQGYLTSLSNVYLSTLTSQYSYAFTISSLIEQVSTSIIQKIIVTNSIELGGTAQIQGDITVGGDVDFFSTLDVFQSLILSTNAIIGGNFSSISSVLISGPLTVGGFASTPNNLLVGDSLFVDQSVFAEGALLPKNLSVQTLFLNTFSVNGPLQTAQTISTQSNVRLSNTLVSLGSTLIHSSLDGSQVFIDNTLNTSSMETFYLSSLAYMSIGGSASVRGATSSGGNVSSFGTTSIQRMTNVSISSVFGSNIFVNDLSRFDSLTVQGNLTMSNLYVYSSIVVNGSGYSYGSTFQVSDLSVYGNIDIGRSLLVQGGTSYVATGISTTGNIGVADFNTGETLYGGSLTVGEEIHQTNTSLSNTSFGGNLSTGFLDVQRNAYVKGSLFIQNFLEVSTLAAPIALSISTLSLSNVLRVNEEGFVPVLDMNSFPDKIFVGTPIEDRGTVLTVEGNLQNTTLITQTNTTQGTWWGNQIVASTFSLPTPVSTTVFGPITEFKPFLLEPGVIVTGIFPGFSTFFHSSNVSTNFTPGINGFSGIQGGSKLAFDGTSRWVAVGSALLASNSILYSDGGYRWNAITAGGFGGGGGCNVAYGNGRWIAVGQPLGGQTSIQYSLNGIQWQNTVNAFPNLAYDVAYNGSNLWVAAGVPSGVGFGSAPGIKYSQDGITWQDATLIPPFEFIGGSVAYGNGQWIVTGFQNSTIAASVDGINYSYLISDFNRTNIRYNGSIWVAGGLALNGSPLPSLQISPNGIGWFPALSGGFTDRCESVAWDSNRQLWYAAGYNSPTSTNAVYYSSDAVDWFPINLPPGSRGRGIAAGTLFAPDTENYLTFNRTSILHSTLSSVNLFASTVQASTIFSDAFAGDGALLSNVTSFRGSIFTSSFQASEVRTLDIQAQRIETEFMTVSDTITVSTNKFISAINIWVAAGADSETNGNIQTGFTGLNWLRGTGTTFSFYGTSIVGNCNAANPVFVATGADTVGLRTIQYSLDGRTWFPITQGGFHVLVDGVCQGNSVAYNSNLAIWVAAGNNQGTVSTLYYSTDAQNWFPALNAFSNRAKFVAASPYGFISLGTTGVKYSGDGIHWLDSITNVTFDTVAFGKVGPIGGNFDTWLGFSNLSIYSSPDGNEWILQGVSVNEVIASAVYGGSFWVGVGCNIIQYSSNGFFWVPVTTTFAPDTLFNTVAYNSNQNRWVAGALSTTADKSLWSSSNLQTWLSAQSGGFSTSIVTDGIGYGVFTSSLYTFAVGQASFGGITPVKQTILGISSTGAGSYVTEIALSLENTSNVFQTQVRGIAGTPEQLYSYVAVGDGATPQRTIARSLQGSGNTWVPAITGGFSTTGYAVTYYIDRWVAVGDAQTSTNVIQYSPDGANWFGTNTAIGLRQGGRGIGVGVDNYYSTLVAVGKDMTTSTILRSLDGYTWTNTTGSYFIGQGNAVAGGLDGAMNPTYIAVGSDIRGSMSTILQSSDGFSWSNITSGGFTGGGYGIAYGLGKFVAVGVDANAAKTIQYSTDGGNTFIPSATGGFTVGGYGVAFNPQSNLFFAVGEDVGALRNATIKFSSDAQNWSNISTLGGFQSQTTLGAAYSVFTQAVEVIETIPFLEFPNLIVYERTEPLFYPKATIRLQSSFMALNECMYANLSSQLIYNCNVPFNESTILTVYGNIYASSFLYTGSLLPSDTLLTSSLVMSTISSTRSIKSIYLTTPHLEINTNQSKANFISSSVDVVYNSATQSNISTKMLNINDVLFTTASMPDLQQTGIRLSTPSYDLDIEGSFGVSSLSTSYLLSLFPLQFKQAEGPFFQASTFSIVSGTETDIPITKNSILATPSSLIINSVVTISLSSQKVGFYTKDPQFSLDVRSQTYITNLSTHSLNTSLLFLTLQSE